MMKSKLALLLLFFGLNALNISAQDLGEWRAYPSFSTVNDISADGDEVYSATLGGIYKVEEGEITLSITAMDGMYRSDPTALIMDEDRELLFAGYIDGMIDVIDLGDENSISTLADIFRANRFNSRRVNDFMIHDGNLYVATSFGIVVYTLDGLYVENSYTRLGSFTAATPVSGLDITADTLYAATEQGVAVGALADNLVEAANWQNYGENAGLQPNIVQQVKKTVAGLYALSQDSLFVIDESAGDATLQPNFDNGSILTMARNADGSRLAVATRNRMVLVDENGATNHFQLDLGSDISTLEWEGNNLHAGTTNEGLVVFENASLPGEQHVPSGPYLNFFNNLLVDGETLVATSSGDFPRIDPLNPVRGYYIFNEGEWHNFNQNTNETMADFRMSNVFSVAQTDSAYYFGSWGYGVVEHSKSTNEISIYNRQNSALRGINSNVDFVVIPSLASDSDNNIWATSFLSSSPLNVKLAGSDSWQGFGGRAGGDHYYHLFIDSNDQKWISLINSGNVGQGLMVLRTGDPEDPADDRFVKLTSNQNNGNLPDEKVNVFAEDQNGEIWIGTNRGIARFVFPELIIDGGPGERQAQWLINEDTTVANRFLLRDVHVTALAVNDANQKWVGSLGQGLWLLNDAGSRIEKHYNVENSDLPSNDIESIAIEHETGRVYVATSLGLVSLQDVPQKPVNSMKELKVFPNPFSYNRHSQIVIEGLSQSTQIKIMGVDGTVVNELEATGGRVSWDARDYNGNRLGSGVYYVVAYEGDSRERGMGKVVIVR